MDDHPLYSETLPSHSTFLSNPYWSALAVLAVEDGQDETVCVSEPARQRSVGRPLAFLRRQRKCEPYSARPTVIANHCLAESDAQSARSKNLNDAKESRACDTPSKSSPKQIEANFSAAFILPDERSDVSSNRKTEHDGTAEAKCSDEASRKEENFSSLEERVTLGETFLRLCTL